MRENLTDIGILGMVMIAVVMIIVLFYNGCGPVKDIKLVNPSPKASVVSDHIHVILPFPEKVIDWRRLPARQ